MAAVAFEGSTGLAIDDLPLPVVTFLNVIGVPWPYINEDTVSEFASLVRRFGQAVQATHQDATRAVAGAVEAYRSAASETMSDGWEKLSGRHVTEILDGCTALAGALDVATAYIVTQKGAAILTLGEMATAFLTAQAAAVAAGNSGSRLELDPAAARAHAQALSGYAADLRGHAETFAAGIRGLAF
jgi:hypothetical protein